MIGILESLAQGYVKDDSKALSVVDVENLSYGHTPGNIPSRNVVQKWTGLEQPSR